MLQIRLARPEEFAEVGALTVAAYVESGSIEADREYVASLRDVAGRDGEVFVAVEDETIVATVTWCPPSSGSREVAREGEGEMRALAVPTRHQRRGIGRALVWHVLDLARQEGLEAVVVSSATTMRAAHHLYPSLGFVRCPDLDWRPVPDVQALGYRYALHPES